MSEVREFFRHCPACGRRFHIKLVSKKLTDERREVEEVKKGMAGYGGVAAPLGYGATSPLVVEEDVPVTVDIKDFQYSYRCKACGHEWSETHVRETKE